MSLLQQILQRGDGSLGEIDDGVPNKFRWEWLEKTVSVNVKKDHPKVKWTSDQPLEMCLKDCIRKIKQPGKAICTVCYKTDSDVIRYGNGGVNVIKQHLSTKGHVMS